jgi:hypothetical protein
MRKHVCIYCGSGNIWGDDSHTCGSCGSKWSEEQDAAVRAFEAKQRIKFEAHFLTRFTSYNKEAFYQVMDHSCHNQDADNDKYVSDTTEFFWRGWIACARASKGI